MIRERQHKAKLFEGAAGDSYRLATFRMSRGTRRIIIVSSLDGDGGAAHNCRLTVN